MIKILRTDLHEAILLAISEAPELVERGLPGEFKFKNIRITAWEVNYQGFSLNGSVLPLELFDRCAVVTERKK